MFCKLAQKECYITQEIMSADTFEKKITVKGLKDCSEKTCGLRGQNGCLLKKEA